MVSSSISTHEQGQGDLSSTKTEKKEQATVANVSAASGGAKGLASGTDRSSSEDKLKTSDLYLVSNNVPERFNHPGTILNQFV